MSREIKNAKPLSLAQCFEAPDEYIGHFGWMCGYSGNAGFLNNALERFTGQTQSTRAQAGNIVLAMMLDPSAPKVECDQAPGVAHLAIKTIEGKPFRLLHAKVAVLGFRHISDGNESSSKEDKWKLRLIVSTGNWTRQTLEESLDLVWWIEIDSASVNSNKPNVEQERIDFKAAWKLLTQVQDLFDTRILNISIDNKDCPTKLAQQQVKKWIEACTNIDKDEPKPRFIDNRSHSFLDQLPELVKNYGDTKRRYLAMGSGFYEGGAQGNYPAEVGLPKVPQAIIDQLTNNNLLDSKAIIDIFVNPEACQAIAASSKAINQNFENIRIRQAAIPQYIFGQDQKRTLHAKFLFSANGYRKAIKQGQVTQICNSAWIYLGSGNITNPGFMKKMHPLSGNLEAGVVFAPHRLSWIKHDDNQESEVVSNLLPIQWDTEAEPSNPDTDAEVKQSDEVYVAAPVALLVWFEAEGRRELQCAETESSAGNSAVAFEVLDPDGKACLRTATGYQWSGAQPSKVKIVWTEKTQTEPLEAWIPVVDQYGRIGATPLAAIDVALAWDALASFPLTVSPEDEEGDDSEEGDGAGDSTGSGSSTTPEISHYPIRQMMELLEKIASKQTTIGERDWGLWCNRLEQTLSQACESSVVKYFSENLKINPLSPLRQSSFRPEYAETCEQEPGKKYEEALDRIEERWKVNHLTSLGVNT